MDTTAAPKLNQLTDPEAVQDALIEFHFLGRDDFLAKYGLERSRDYFLEDKGVLVDSKPILAVAYRNQFPERGLLPVSAFSGGFKGAVAAIEKLGFSVETRATFAPPQLATTLASRTAVQAAYGGDKVAGIIRFPGDEIVNIFSDAEGPYADDPPSLAEPFGYRGEGLSGPQRLQQRGNALLEAARSSQVPARFWYRPVGEQFSFLAWVVVLGRAWVAGTGQDGKARRELEWQLQALAGDAASIPSAVQEAVDEAAQTLENDPAVPEAQIAPSYAALIERVETRGQHPKPTGVPRTDFARSAAARRAVLIRSGGACESARCTGMPAEVNRSGNPILDVDHIKDLGLGGEDHPRNMAALCPNCHACKTRGANVARWRRELLKAAAGAHLSALAK